MTSEPPAPRASPQQPTVINLDPPNPSPAPSLPTAPTPPNVIPNNDSPARAAKASEADRIVLEYLRMRGFRQAEQALTADISTVPSNPHKPVDIAAEKADVDDDFRNAIMMLKKPAELADSDVRRYEHSYCELRDWVDGSLDIYKPELHSILYPLLVHCFLEMVRREHPDEARTFLARCSAEFSEAAASGGSAARKDELTALSGVATPQHLEHNQTARLFLSHRYELHLSSYAFELILSFLADDPRRAVLLRILNQRCRLLLDEVPDTSARASGIDPAKGTNEADVSGFVPTAERTTLLRNDVLWGRLRPEHYMIPDEQDPNAKKGKKPTGDKGKAADAKKTDAASKKDGQADEEEEPVTNEDGTISASRIPLKRYRYGAPGLETLLDRKNRADLQAQLTSDTAKSELAVLFYTFTNTRDDGLNCSAVSEDGSQVVAGFGDSSVRIWDSKRAGTAGSGESGMGGGSVRLVGHSGPVYSVDWTKCARFVLSGSEDGSVRLWNVELKTDLVAYHGHNYPVWSTAFSPLDHYFASGSHDRTARVWSTDRIYPLRILAGHLADVDVVRWHPNCNYVATGSSDRTARLWDIREGKCARVFGGSGGTIHSLAFSPDGRTLACGGDGSTIDIWDIASGKRIKRLAGHKSTVWSLDYSREGAIMASGGADHRVCIWRATDWSKIIEDVEDDGGAVNGPQLNGAANGKSGEVNDIDADGDAKMTAPESSGNGKAPEASEGDGQKKATGGNAPQQNEPTAEKKMAEEATAAQTPVVDAQTSPLLETFTTKETPVYTVKFTRRNVLIGTGSFGT